MTAQAGSLTTERTVGRIIAGPSRSREAAGVGRAPLADPRKAPPIRLPSNRTGWAGQAAAPQHPGLQYTEAFQRKDDDVRYAPN